MKKIFTLLLTGISIYSYGQVDLNAGLQAYYSFSGNANDVSGNNNNAVFNSATLTNDRFGNPNSAYHFNGTSDYIRVPASPSLNTLNQISLCAWVKPMGFYTGPCHGNSIFDKGETVSMRFDDAIFTNFNNCANPTVDIEHQLFYGPLTASVPTYTPYIETDNWYSVVYTYDGTTIRLYVNCELKISLVGPGLNFSTTADLFFGRFNNPTFPYWFNGDLDEMRVYNRPLNQDEVTAYGNCSVNPVSLISFNTTVIDNRLIKLTWDTEAEFNIKNYSVERSTSGRADDFSYVGKVNSKSNSQGNQYSFTDNTAKPNTLYYYRLAIHDLDGTLKYGPVKTAKFTNKSFYTMVYPNPTSGNLKVITNNPGSDVTIKVINSVGEVITTKKVSESNSNAVSLDLSTVSNGVYWVLIQNENERIIEKIIKQ